MNTPRQVQHALLLACALASTLAAAQPVPQAGNYDYAPGQQVQVSTTMIVLLAAVVSVFVFIAISTIYLRHCTSYHGAGEVAALERSIPANSFVSRRQRRPRGLDSAVIRTLPTMKYKEAKALQVGKVQAALECAVCLSEFDDDEQLRLLPKCSHAFHPNCIGQWLAGHVTCPVCRCNLDPNKDTTEEVIIPAAASRETNSASSEIAVLREDDGAQYAAAVVIDVFTEEEEAEERRQEEMELQEIGTQLRKMRSRSGRRRPVTAQLVRSHSTGHSLPVRLDRDLERFTLRLPEHVRREMVAVGEQSLRRGRRAGEGSSPGGRNRRWPTFLSGTLSGKLPSFLASMRGDSSGGGEPSSSSSSSSTRVRGKRVAAVDVADGSAHGAVHLDCTGGSAAGANAASVVSGSAAATVDVWRRRRMDN